MSPRALLAWIWTLIILFLCWLPRQYIPGQEKLPRPFLVINFDKLVHLAIFAVFSYLWMRIRETKYRGLLIFGAGMALAVITEVGQDNQFVNRDANVADALADTLGVIVGIVAFWIVAKIKHKPTGDL